MQLMSESNFGHAKGSCYRCGQTSPVVDFDAYIEGEGVLCLCRGCLTEAAHLLGFATEGEGAEAVLELEHLRARNGDLESLAEAARTLLRSIETAKVRFTKQVPSGV